MPTHYGMPPARADPLAAYKAGAPATSFGGDSPYNPRENHALREHSFIQNTEAQLDSFIAQGRSVLGNLVEQRSILKGTRRRLLDAANTVGLSRELIVRLTHLRRDLSTGSAHRTKSCLWAEPYSHCLRSVRRAADPVMIYRWFG